MKTLYPLLLCLLVSSAYSQNEIIIDFTHLMDEQSFQLETEHPQNNTSGNNFTFNRCEFYLADFSITHDGGQVTDIQDTWLLVRPAEQSSFSLGTHNITDVESISWSLGIGQDVNHEDPTLWEVGHPLAPQNPSMHWGWTSGYRFIAIEGLAGENVNLTWEIHALGDDNYFEKEIATGSTLSNDEVHIGITGNYANFLFGVSIDGGVIAHGEGGPTVNRVFNNSLELVFTATDGTPVSIAQAKTSAFEIYPNPSSNTLNLRADQQIEDLEIFSAIGQKLLISQDNSVLNQIDISSLPVGSYTIRVKVQGQWTVSRFIKS